MYLYVWIYKFVFINKHIILFFILGQMSVISFKKIAFINRIYIIFLTMYIIYSQLTNNNVEFYIPYLLYYICIYTPKYIVKPKLN